MGAVLAVLGGLGELLATGFTAEAIFAGEAAAIVESQVAAITALEGLTEAEALAALGLTADSAVLLNSAPLALDQALSLAFTTQAVAGFGGLTAASVRYFQEQQQKNHHHRNMALEVWQPPAIDMFFPGANEIANGIYSLNPLEWGPTLFNRIAQSLWDSIIDTGRRQIGMATQAATQQAASTLYDLAARAAENARWYVLETPTRTYQALKEYYSQVSVLPPSARRGRALFLADEDEQIFRPTPEPEVSGESIYREEAPGGAQQRTCPDWMLPLILGLYGTVYPGWRAEVNLLEHNGTQSTQKVQRIRRSPSTRSQTPYQRRNRSSRSKNRAR
nr:VP2 [Polyomavirus sp.]